MRPNVLLRLSFAALFLINAQCAKEKSENSDYIIIDIQDTARIEPVFGFEKIKIDTPPTIREYIITGDIQDTARTISNRASSSFLIGQDGQYIASAPFEVSGKNAKKIPNGWLLPNQKAPISTGTDGDYIQVPLLINGEPITMLFHKKALGAAFSHLSKKK